MPLSHATPELVTALGEAFPFFSPCQRMELGKPQNQMCIQMLVRLARPNAMPTIAAIHGDKNIWSIRRPTLTHSYINLMRFGFLYIASQSCNNNWGIFQK